MKKSKLIIHLSIFNREGQQILYPVEAAPVEVPQYPDELFAVHRPTDCTGDEITTGSGYRVTHVASGQAITYIEGTVKKAIEKSIERIGMCPESEFKYLIWKALATREAIAARMNAEYS